MATAAQVKATTNYIKNHMRQFVVRCNNNSNRDVIDYLEECGNVTAEIKRLVRKEIEESQK